MELVKGPTYSHEEMLAHMVAQYEVTLLRICYMYLHDKALAEDATQSSLPRLCFIYLHDKALAEDAVQDT